MVRPEPFQGSIALLIKLGLGAASARAQGQGFYYSHAVTAEETMRMLRSGVVHPENAPPDT